MILWKFKETHEEKAEYDNVGRRGWRWVFEATGWNEGWGIGLQRQVIFHDSEKPEWASRCEYFVANVTRHFALGQQHIYYDGPHCSFSIGWLHLNWSYWWCKKCMPDQDSPCYNGDCKHSYHQE
jgi:hypothetical protein